MARKKKHAGHGSHERWLVSYADFITLLFAFFVVMFASSQTDRGRTARMEQSVKKALQEDHLVQKLAKILGGDTAKDGQGNAQMRGPGGSRTGGPDKPADSGDDERAGLREARADLTGLLRDEIRQGAVEVAMDPRGLVISLQQAAFFPSGGDEIPAESLGTLEKVAEVIARVPNPVRFEGHTDSLPLKGTARFRSNWELSAARAIAMMEALVECCGLSRERFSIGGYAENAPIADNETEEGRGRNRRVDIVILSEAGQQSEPYLPGRN
ncbi:MAG: flagellar motor protein MotB [Bryobacteraceae bacterium]